MKGSVRFLRSVQWDRNNILKGGPLLPRRRNLCLPPIYLLQSVLPGAFVYAVLVTGVCHRYSRVVRGSVSGKELKV
jgi:hypothetical protein